MSASRILRILQESRVIAVVGYSDNPERPSHWISDYLEKAGYRVFRVNPTLVSTPVRPIWKSLREIPEPIDVVDVFRAPPQVPEVAAAAAAAAAKVLWLQPGAENEQAAAQARAAGLETVVGRCIYAEHRAHFGAAPPA